MTFSVHGTGGGGYAAGPVENAFSGVDLAAAQAARDAYFASNPTVLAAYDSNPFYLIRLSYDSTTNAEYRQGGQWIDYTPFLQGLPGEVASLVGVPVGEIPYKKLDGTFGGSRMRVLDDGSLLAPPGFGVESGSVKFGDVLLLSEAAGFLAISNLLNDRQYTVLDYWTPRDGASQVPSAFLADTPAFSFVAQPDDSVTLTANPLTFDYTIQNTSRTYSLFMRAAAAMNNVRIKITQVSNNVTLKYVPTKEAWETGTGGLNWAIGDNNFDFGDTPLVLRTGQAVRFEIEADTVSLKGNSLGITYFGGLDQLATFQDIVMARDNEPTDIRDKLAGLAGNARLGIDSIKDAVTTVAGRTGAVVLSASDVSGLAPVATTGAYSDLTGLPFIPSDTSDLTNGAAFITSAQAPVQSVAGRTGAVVVTKADVGLSNVDNTSDVNKPTSTAQQASIDLKMTQHNANADPHPQYTTTAEASAAAPVQSVNALTGNVSLTTALIPELTNLYFTDARVQTYITGAGYNVKSVGSVGAGASFYQGNSSGAVSLRSIIGTGALTVTQNANDITLFTSIANSGVGAGVVKGTVTGTTTMKGITAGRGMTITGNTDDVQVSSTAFPLIYNSGGQAASPKVWYGTVTSDVDGLFSINIASAGFTVAPIVQVSSVLSTATQIDRAWASLATVSTTTATGYTLRGSAVSGSGDSTRPSPNTVVHVMAIGI
jgi:hypothetical protein